MKRFQVTIEREVIVYADSKDGAKTKALAFLQAITQEVPAARPIKVVEVVELPETDPTGELIDRAPSRETRT